MPQIVYCTDNKGYYTHSGQCTIDPLESVKQGRDVYVLPANGYLDAPVIAEGCVARRVNDMWVAVENHVGEKGFVNGVPFEIKEYGPLPEGWSDTPPPLSGEDLRIERKMTTLSRLAQIDSESMRPLRAKLSGTATADDDARILALENEASQLREELARIMSWQT